MNKYLFGVKWPQINVHQTRTDIRVEEQASYLALDVIMVPYCIQFIKENALSSNGEHWLMSKC